MAYEEEENLLTANFGRVGSTGDVIFSIVPSMTTTGPVTKDRQCVCMLPIYTAAVAPHPIK